METPSNFHVNLELRIDWSELDYFGHVNNVSFFKYIQSARVNYWENIGLNSYFSKYNIGPMLASCKCDFKQPLYFPGSVKIISQLEFIKHTSFGIHHRLINNNGELSAEANDVMVMFDFSKNEKVKFPDEVKSNLEKLGSKTF